jgi:SAM-dependent methyltransferase
METGSTWICLMCWHPNDVGINPVGDRDGALCFGCGASTRARAMAQAFLATMGPLSVVHRADRPRAAGISDNPVLARWLERFTDYVGFQFGEESHLDLTDVPRWLEGSFEIVTCGDVLEHVAPPVNQAFEGLARLLAPGGFAIVSVPAGPEEVLNISQISTTGMLTVLVTNGSSSIAVLTAPSSSSTTSSGTVEKDGRSRCVSSTDPGFSGNSSPQGSST